MKNVLAFICVTLIALPLSAQANESLNIMDYVPPQPGLVKLYYSVESGDAEPRSYTDVAIMDATQNGITRHYRYGPYRGEWTFQRLLTACDFFSVYWEVNAEVLVSSSAEEARAGCEQTWPLAVGDVVESTSGRRFTVEQLVHQSVLINGEQEEHLAYVVSSPMQDDRRGLRWSAQGIGTVGYQVGDDGGFQVDLMTFGHPATGHILGRCIPHAPAEACLCAARKAAAWLSSEALDTIIGNIELAWPADQPTSATPGEGSFPSRVADLSRLSEATCDVDIAEFVY